MKKNSKVWIGLLVSVILVVWIASKTDWSSAFSELKSYNWIYLIPAILFFWIHFILRAYRWKWLLGHGANNDSSKKINFNLFFDSLMVGNLATFLLPLRVGEFIRPFLYSKNSGTSFPTAFVSVVIERFFDLATVLLCFGILVSLSPSGADPALISAAVVLVSVASVIAIFILLASIFPDLLTKIYDFAIKPLPEVVSTKTRPIFLDFLSGARVLANLKVSLNIVFLTVLIWLSTVVRFYVFLGGFASLELSWLLCFVLTISVALSVAAPSAPGFIGVYEIGCIAAFKIVGVEGAEIAVAFAILSHAFEYALIGVFGALGLVRQGVKFGELQGMSLKAESN